jgi:hypothetical protein
MNHVCLLKGAFLLFEENIMWKLFALLGVWYLQKGLNFFLVVVLLAKIK